MPNVASNPGAGQPSTEVIGLADFQALQSRILVAQAVSQGRAHSNNSNPAATFTAPGSIFVLAALNTVRGSGRFRAGITCSWVDSAASDTITWTVVSFTTSTGNASTLYSSTVTGGTAVGINCFESSTATTPLVPLGSFNSVTQAQFNQTLGASFPTVDGIFSWNAVIGAAAATTLITGFALGNLVAIALQIKATNSLTLSGVGLVLEEEPY